MCVFVALKKTACARSRKPAGQPPFVQRLAGRRDHALLDNRAVRLAHTAADALFVYVQANVIWDWISNAESNKTTISSRGSWFVAEAGSEESGEIEKGRLTHLPSGLEDHRADHQQLKSAIGAEAISFHAQPSDRFY
jgi:hypothetical protein